MMMMMIDEQRTGMEIQVAVDDVFSCPAFAGDEVALKAKSATRAKHSWFFFF